MVIVAELENDMATGISSWVTSTLKIAHRFFSKSPLYARNIFASFLNEFLDIRAKSIEEKGPNTSKSLSQ